MILWEKRWRQVRLGKIEFSWGVSWCLTLWLVSFWFDPRAPKDITWWQLPDEFAFYLWPLGIQISW